MAEARGTSVAREAQAQEWLRNFLHVIFFIFTISSILAFTITGAVGIGLTLLAVWIAHGDLIKSVPYILEGIEFLLLAPVPFAVIECVGEYLITLRWDKESHSKSESRLNQVKGLVATLIVTVVAVELLRRFISRPVATDMTDLYFGVGLIIVLLVYRIVIFGWPPNH